MKLIYLISRVFFGLDFFKFSGPLWMNMMLCCHVFKFSLLEFWMNAINNQVLERPGMNTEASFLIVLIFVMFQLLSSIDVVFHVFKKSISYFIYWKHNIHSVFEYILELCLYYVTTNNQKEFFKNKISLGFFLNRKANEFWIQKILFK